MNFNEHKQVDFRRKFLKLVGAEIEAVDSLSSQPVGFIKMKAWKLREDIRLYSDKSQQDELLRIHARNIIDFSATYDILDSKTNQPLFALKRKGLKSAFVRDHWDILDTQGAVIGAVQETSSGLALARRWLEILPFGEFIGLIFAFITQTYTISLQGAGGTAVTVGKVTHQKNPLVVKMHLDMTMAPTESDARLGFAAVALLSVVDATKND